MDIFIGTTNRGKQREILALFLDTPVHIVFPQDVPKVADLEVTETGSTFEENALLKAQTYAEQVQLVSAADDSGLEVLALDGFPGVQSNRWHSGTSKERVLALLKRMEGNPDRRARFVTVVCLFDPLTKETTYFKGEISGKLAESFRGDEQEGFEYDFIFIPDGQTKTFAELGRAWKVQNSHRTRAFQQMKRSLLSIP